MGAPWTLTLVTAPTSEPISLAEAKAWLRLEIDEDDAIVSALISAARGAVENHARRALLTQTWKLQTRSLDEHARLVLPRAPLQSVQSFKYLVSGVATTWSSTDYVVVPGLPGRVHPIGASWWPTADDRDDAYEITFRAGHADTIAGVPADVAELARTAIFLLIGHWYEHREAVIAGTIASDLPLGVATLCQALRPGRYL